MMQRVGRRRRLRLAGFALVAGAVCACSSPRVHRLTDFLYLPKASDAPVEAFVGKLARPYETIAIVDSDRYGKKDKPAKEQMLEDLRCRTRELGGDAVQDVRLLPVKIRGMVPDERVPMGGAWRQGRYELYFLRGEVVKYVREIGLPPSTYSMAPVEEPAEDTAEGVVREPAISEDSLAVRVRGERAAESTARPATPEILHVPSLAVEED